MKPANYPTAPAHLWDHFYEISRLPRPSKQEQRVREYVIGLAESSGHPWRQDTAGNVVIYVPASDDMTGRETVIIQNHLDMVTVKTGDKEHDFTTDPLTLEVEEGWLHADRTTLGADNGLGCAAALALMTDTGVSHPPLELLFTVDEETGLGGALNLDAEMLSGSHMLNLDTEDWHELYVGCAGGGGWELRRDLVTESVPAHAECWQLSLSGLAGGHSGIQIQEQLGNAIKLLGQCLQGVAQVRLAEAEAGIAHNVIPREGHLLFACPPGTGAELQLRFSDLRAQWLGYLPKDDESLQLVLEPASFETALSTADTVTVLDVIAALPHGAQAYSLVQRADLVDLSVNLARLELRDGALLLETSFRYFNTAQCLPLQQQVLGIARAFGLKETELLSYPGWEPDFDSPLLARAAELHEQLFGERPAIKAIHAGLECGILKGKYPDTDILSFGPTIRGAHSPTERLQIDTVEPFWRFLTALLREL
ncbi:MAG: beta-Ala-His dipeptidase [Pseudomonadota bacterium]